MPGAKSTLIETPLVPAVPVSPIAAQTAFLDGSHQTVSRRLPSNEYSRLVREIQRVVKTTIPLGATVAVVSKGDQKMVDFKGRLGCHFPQNEDGGYAGYHPADSAAAIAELERLRHKDIDYLLVPHTAFWWLDHYEDFGRRLASSGRKVWQDQSCLIFQLSNRQFFVGRYARTRLGLALTRAPAAARPEADELRLAIDSRIPEQMTLGQGTAFYLAGWCYHPKARIQKLEIVTQGVAHPVTAWGVPRPDVQVAHGSYLDHSRRCYHSGFWGFVPFCRIEKTLEASIALRATLSNGKTCEKEVARIRLHPGFEARNSKLDPQVRTPRVAICMATYNPAADLFQRQVDSIRNQTFSDWVCLISDDGSRPDIFEQARRIIGDDPRFQVHRSKTGVGFYANFERCLSLVPENCEFVALSDHDDYWHPDKLQSLLAAFAPTTTLAYSDMRVVDAGGRELSPTYWTTRPNNSTRLASLLMANTITGAAALFRRNLLSLILPFPQRIGEAYHDHWIGITALATGTIKYVDRPLYDYVQHGSNVIGHYAPTRPMAFWPAGSSLRRFGESAREAVQLWQRVYFSDLLRLQLMIRVLQLRCGSLIPSRKAADLRRIETLGRSSGGLFWLVRRIIAAGRKISETVGAERPLLGAALWRHAARFRWWQRLGNGGRHTRHESAADRSAARTPANVEILREKVAALSLLLSRQAPPRANLLIPTIDLDYFFGGYITKFNLAQRLSDEGLKVRLVVVDHCDWRPAHWRDQLKKFHGLERFFDRVELAYVYDRSVRLEVNPADVFLATTWWTAHVAHQAARTLGAARFLYLIQEYEAFTFPMGSFAALANQSYEFPHYAIFSSELLRQYFLDHRLGVFAEGAEWGGRNSTSFENAITDVGQVSQRDLAKHSCKRLLFYARPEPHAARNMFELGILALIEAIQDESFEDGWEFYGIGCVGSAQLIPLARGRTLTLLPRDNQSTYRDILRAHDLGLALMYTPHPSLVPIEMASAGMVVVTTAYANKTQEALGKISANLIAVQPTVEQIKQGLKTAVARLEDHDSRVAGSHVNWATHWGAAFNPQVMSRIRQFVEGSRAHGTGSENLRVLPSGGVV